MKTSSPGRLAPSLVSAALVLLGCGRPVVGWTVDEEPICSDFTDATTRATLAGSMRRPVKLTVREGSAVVASVVLSGVRSKDAARSTIALPDATAEYTAEWSQCIERRPAPLGGSAPAWACGATAVYKTEPLVSRRGDAASRRLTFALPPEAGCWLAEAPIEPPPRGGGPGQDGGAPGMP